MELTKKALDDVKFRTRGRWYSAEQVDAFLEELAVCADESEREWKALTAKVHDLESQVENLREENVRLWKQTQELKAAVKSAPKADPLNDLKQQRNELINDIKALKKFRETFKAAVERDAKSLNEQLKELESYKML